MAVRPVLRYPHPMLKRAAEPVGAVTDGLRELAGDLLDTMRAGPATVGLAAPQIGEPARALVLDVGADPRATTSHGPVTLFDPVIVETADPDVLREGCLSVPDLTADVSRARRVVVRGLGLDGSPVDYEMHGFEARALLHEVDHLDGRLILDRVATASELFPRRVYR
ncbi:MAG: peptide deformylase [Actinomycetota bacterium]